MGEIKSTIDLVMEKTRHLTLSREEKDAQKKVEVHKRLKGLVQKYQDNLLRKDRLEKELDILNKTYDMNVICDLQENLPFLPQFLLLSDSMLKR
jgi:hypothetical protein